MKIRDRIQEFRRVKAAELRPNPRNWRTHPPQQREALQGILAEIGYADALLARPLPDGSLELLDGHLRAETTPDQEVPVLILDLDDAEAAKLLATLDPLASLAETNSEALESLLHDVETENEALGRMLDDLLSPSQSATQSPALQPPEVPVPEAFQVVIECDDENQQQAIYERMTREGFSCRLLTL